MELSVDDLNTLNPQEVCVVCASILHPNPGGDYRGNSPPNSQYGFLLCTQEIPSHSPSDLFVCKFVPVKLSMSMNIKMVHRSLFKLGIFSNVNVHEHLTVATSTQL